MRVPDEDHAHHRRGEGGAFLPLHTGEFEVSQAGSS